MHLSWFIYFELLSLVTAVFCWRGLRACSLLAFIPLLFIANVTEIVGTNYHLFHWTSNYFVYNVYLLLSTPFLFFLAGKMLFLTKKETIIYMIVCSLALLLIIFNFVFLQGFYMFNTYSAVLVEILIIIFSGLCLIRLTVLDEAEINIMKEPYFWINTLNLMFGLISLVILGLQSYILANHIQIAHRSLYYAILPVVDAILYTGYSYAFILCRMQTQR